MHQPAGVKNMGLFAIKGQVTAIGQSVFDNTLTIYAYVEITAVSGQRVMIEKVAVCNDISAALHMGLSGEFFVDRLFRLSQDLRCQLWGIKTDGTAVFDSRNLRVRIGVVKLMYGLLLTPIFGLGLLLIVPSLLLLLGCLSGNRRQMFYGSDNTVAQPQERRVVRI
jgi:hypothetical protein